VLRQVNSHDAFPSNPRQSRQQRLGRDIDVFARTIGPRNIHYRQGLDKAAAYCEAALREAGYSPHLETFAARDQVFRNIVAELAGSGRRDEIVVVGAHYDTHKDSPGANDNASAVAALLELSRALAHIRPERTLRFVAFTNEESPFTRTEYMGSRVYARQCRQRGEAIVAMIGLEMLGSCSPHVGSQWLSFGGLFLPRRGNFLALVGNRRSRALLGRATEILTRESAVPIRSVTLPTNFPAAWSSDHWSFWKEGYPAIMATDTGPLRYAYYHTTEDTPEKLDLGWTARIVDGLQVFLETLVRTDSIPSPLGRRGQPGA
jgi:Zn-dependent M28 family amino/carboxypeptidase